MTTMFRLELTFAGLCFFVPNYTDGDDASGRIHVLFPETEAMDGMPQHYPRMVTSLDYYKPRSTPQAIGGDGVVSNNEQVFALEGYPDIDWTQLAPSSPRPQPLLPPQIANASTLARKAGWQPPDVYVDPQWTGSTLPPDNGVCAARITLPGDVTLKPFNMADMKIDLGAGDERLVTAACVSCSMDVAAINLRVPLNPAVVLTPSAGVIRILFGNMIAEDYTHPPAPRPKMMPHFGLYYGLLRGSFDDPPVPHGGQTPGGGVDPVTCMTGGGCIIEPC